MATFKQDGFTFFDGFFKNPVFQFDNIDIKNKIKYIKQKQLKCISLSDSLETLSFLSELEFVEEIYITKIHAKDYINLYKLEGLKRLILNVTKNEPQLEFSNFKNLEYLSIDWYSKFPDLTSNFKLKELIIWKFKPKNKSIGILKLPKSLEHLKITESNIQNLEELSIPNLKKFEGYYCNKLISLNGINKFSSKLEVLILENCKKITDYNSLGECIELKKIILSNCGSIETLKWLAKLKKVNHLSFWGTELLDGDTSYCKGINYISFKYRKNYSHQSEELLPSPPHSRL